MKKAEFEETRKIFNVAEDEVVKKVNALYDQVKTMQLDWLKCDCQQCRLDTICYVLNRVPPKYIVSGRGANHVLASRKNRQHSADMEKLIIEGMKIVNSVSRPFHNTIKAEQKKNKGDVYNFPTFYGVVLDGITFEPLENAKITLLKDGEVCKMIDFTWLNPCTVRKSMNGTYSFLVESIPADDEIKDINFRLEVEADGYEKLIHNFSTKVLKENAERDSSSTTYSMKIQDLFLFPQERK